MTAIEVLSLARSRRIILILKGERIRYRGPRGAMTPDLKSAIVETRADLLPLLRWGRGGMCNELPRRWRTGPIDSCIFCGKGTAAHDDQGIPRHPTC